MGTKVKIELPSFNQSNNLGLTDEKTNASHQVTNNNATYVMDSLRTSLKSDDDDQKATSIKT